MKKFLTEVFKVAIFTVIIGALMYCVIWYVTSPEQWYVGMHDSKCEKSLYDEPCNCYERLVAADKARNNK